jgi:hypothetical protein
MAKKTITPEMELKTAIESILNGSGSVYFNVNGILLSKNKLDRIVIVVPDKLLLEGLIEDKTINIEELTIDHQYFKYYNNLFKYGEGIDSDDWISLQSDELYAGNTIDINIKDYECPIQINKDLLPIKLKKSEYENIFYRIFMDPLIIGLRKDFKSINEGYSFSMLTLFRII